MSVIIETDCHDPAENLALEEYLTQQCQEVTLYLWQNSDTVVIGRNQNPWRECRVELLYGDGVRLVRRNTGGGAVFHDLGNLNYTFVAPKHDFDLDRQFVTVKNALASLGVDCERSGRNDMLCNGKKFSGCAFSHNKTVSVQHATLLIDADVRRMAKYLSVSEEKMKSKGICSVHSRVCNLSEYAKISVEDVETALKRAFEAEYGCAKVMTGDIPRYKYQALAEKYNSWEWTFGETLEFEITCETRLDFGEIQLHLNVKDGKISGVKVFSDALDVEFIDSIAPKLLGCRYDFACMARVVDDDSPQGRMLAQWLNSKNAETVL